MNDVSLSIVIGAAAGEEWPWRCLAALANQVDDDVEVIVVTGAPDAAPTHALGRTIKRPGGLVPELWAEGVREARGDLVGLLASTTVPGPDWVAHTRRAHMDGLAVAGGPIEAHAGLTMAEWAAYYCRYAPYMTPIAADSRIEVPADNASYRGSVLRRYPSLYQDGFWEPHVHAALRSEGHRLAFCPERVVRYVGGTSTRRFARQRLAHGRAHGRSRSQALSRAQIVAGLATTPLVPVLMTARVARAVWMKHRRRARFAIVSPIVLYLYCAWALGELNGRIDALIHWRSR